MDDLAPWVPDWVDLGYIEDDGLVIIDDLPAAEPILRPLRISLTLTAPASRLTWWRWQLTTGRPGPDAARVKREYRRRRR
ncbi:hypothetical protein [Nonomuraea roseoviolacea]|uniref:Uncharacterized protein n=1 Tax=Nonomuraea roseoviolacea subsp. carminata TaxID=160689 RepID=A0ABT1KCD2_9ACTN|nr:hypothetical protein [Nonomuraea roseoviolacea]MCP2350644.1 hypothetical protein [Nonomuraea roseoviolacea subsp. carminata]